MKTGLLIVLTSALLLTGCATTDSSKSPSDKSALLNGSSTVLDKHGVPKQKYLIGSGLYINYQVFEGGNIYLVEQNSNTIFEIEGLNEGDRYAKEEFLGEGYSNGSEYYAEFLKEHDVDTDNMKFAVYFIPYREQFPVKKEIAPDEDNFPAKQLVRQEKQPAFDENGLPKAKYLVGGGFSMYYRTPMSGNIHVVAENINTKRKTLIITESLEKNDLYELAFDQTNGADPIGMRLKAIGETPQLVKLKLYFVPSQKTDEVSEK